MINAPSYQVSRRAVYLSVYTFLLLFFALLGHLGFNVVNQVILWVGGPMLALYILEPNLYRIHTIPREYFLYSSLIVFSLLGYINVEDHAGFSRYLQTIVANLALMVIVYFGINNVKEWRYVWWAVVISGMLVCMISFFMDVPTKDNSDSFRLSGIIGNSNGIGNYARVTILGLLISLQFTKKRNLVVLLWLAILFLIYTILLTASRGSFGNLLFILGSYFILRYFKGWKIPVLVILLFLFGNLLFLYGEEFLKNFYLYQRLTRNDSFESAIDQETRVKLYTLAWNTFTDHPFMGVGLNQFRQFAGGKITHTDILDIFVQLGLFAGILYSLIYVKLFKRIINLRKRFYTITDKGVYQVLLITIISEIGYGLSNANWFSQLDMLILSLLIVYTTKINNTSVRKYLPQKQNLKT